MAKEKKVTIRTVSTTTYEIDAEDIRKWQKLPKNANVTFRVPDGDWTGFDLSLDEYTIQISYTTETSE